METWCKSQYSISVFLNVFHYCLPKKPFCIFFPSTCCHPWNFNTTYTLHICLCSVTLWRWQNIISAHKNQFSPTWGSYCPCEEECMLYGYTPSTRSQETQAISWTDGSNTSVSCVFKRHCFAPHRISVY